MDLTLKNDSLVSVIIPTYNRPEYLKRAIFSVLNQTYENIEIIVVDDCPEHPAEAIINEINDPKIVYLKNYVNKGGPYSRNRGLVNTKGTFINFLDDDDEFLPEKLEKQVSKFKTSGSSVGVVTCNVNYLRKDISEIKKNEKRGNIYKDLLKSYCVYGTSSMLIKRELLENTRFDECFESNQEYDLMIRISKNTLFENVDYVGCIQNESENQISYNFRKKISGTKRLWKKYKNEFKKFGMVFYKLLEIKFNYLFLKYYLGRICGLNTYLFINKIENTFKSRFKPL